MENEAQTIKEKEKDNGIENKPKNKRFLTIVIIVQAIIVVIQLVIYCVYKNEQSLYDKELIQIVNNVHHNQQIIQKDIENYDSYENIQYLLKQEDGLEYSVIVQSYNDQDNEVDIMDGYLDAYIKRGNGRQEIENIVRVQAIKVYISICMKMMNSLVQKCMTKSCLMSCVKEYMTILKI